MPYTGGGDPLPVVVGCRWCDFDTERASTHEAALARLLSHVTMEHPSEYEAVIRRQERRARAEPGGGVSDGC